MSDWWHYDGGEELFMIIGVFVLICGFIAARVIGLQYGISKPMCETATADMGMPSRWGFWKGCQVQIEESRWIPLGNWYYVEEK